MRWLKIPEFQKAYREAQRQAFGQSIARLPQATSAAAATLMKIMVDPAAPASVRVRAADSIFTHAAKAIGVTFPPRSCCAPTRGSNRRLFAAVA